MEKICKECGIKKDVSEFNRDKYAKDGYTSKCKYCRSHRYDLTCEYCGKAFKGSHSFQRFCSNNCKGKANEGVNNPAFKDAKIKFKCDNCGEDSEQFKSNHDRTTLHFCSLKCSHEYQVGINGANYKFGEVEYKCDYCGEVSSKKRYQYNNNTYNYCSYECMGKHKTILNRGENNPNWRNGSSEKFNKLYSFLRNSTIDKWRNDSIADCNSKCIVTGKDFECVHHIYGHNKIVSETLEYLNLDLKDLCEYTYVELIELKEKCLELHYKYGLGVCLTIEIHELFHKTYGYGNNTPEQFYEFLDNIKCKSA